MEKKDNIKRILFACIFIMLFIPLMQMQFSMVKVKPLDGAIKEAAKPQLNVTNWFSENFQAEAEKYLNQHFGFRNWFVRLNNQLKYWLFNTAQANGVIVGKESYLYEESYIKAFYGTDFIGREVIEEQMYKLRAVQDSLNARGIDIVLVFAPGKGSFFPEYIPEKYDTVKGITNHAYYVEQAKALGINHIDLSTWFIRQKDTSTYALYPKTGIHWSYYGMNLAADSIVQYIENLRNIDMPDMIWDSIELRHELYGVDNDIEKGMNLLCTIPNFEMPYPRIRIEQKNKTKPKATIIADSYYWQMHNAGYSNSLFADGEFWFYYNTIYPPRKNGINKVKDINLNNEIYQRDVIILMVTEPFLKRTFWGFIDDSYNTLSSESEKERAIRNIIAKIIASRDWTEKIKEKAAEKNIPFEEMLRLDAEYIYSHRQGGGQ